MNALDELFPPPKPYHRGRVARLAKLTPLWAYQKAKSVARRDPEVVFKIGNAGIKNFNHLQEACNYIARNGELELKDQDGYVYDCKEEYKAVLENWRDKQNIPEKNERFSHARRLVLSMPKGTDHEGFKTACEQWAKECLDGYDYLIAYHLEGEDKRTGQPHCHILVRSIGNDGKRLHISNEERELMREHFAKCLNKEGIRATATRRWSRAKEDKGVSQAEHHQQKRRYQSDKTRAKSHAIARKKKERLTKNKKYKEVIRLANNAIRDLENSGYQDDLKLASGLATYYRQQVQTDLSHKPVVEEDRDHLILTKTR